MATALFITEADIKRYSTLSGNIDVDKFLPFIEIAQLTHIREYLGSDLYNKIASDILASTLTGVYSTLVTTYIKPMTIHWALTEFLPFAAFQVSNNGVYKHVSESSESVSKEEVDFLIEKHRSIAQNYTRRFIDYMVYNRSSYPEYDTNTNEDVRPNTTSNFTGWVL